MHDRDDHVAAILAVPESVLALALAEPGRTEPVLAGRDLTGRPGLATDH